MGVIAAAALVVAAATLGFWLGARYLMGSRNRPWLIAAHLALGAAAFELVVLLAGPGDTFSVDGGPVAAWLLAAALVSGIGIAIVAPRVPDAIGLAVAAHAMTGMTALAVFLFWAMP